MNGFKKASFLSIGLLTACASPKWVQETSAHKRSSEPTFKTERKSAETVTSWNLSGAMAARNQTKGWSASLNWTQHGSNQYQIRLSGPLGGGAAMIEKQGSLITYTDGPKKVSGHQADKLLQEQTGVRLPIQNLYYWIRGLPAPGPIQSEQKDETLHTLSLTQNGYTIHYINYVTINHVDLPTKLVLQGHGVTVKLIIKRWSFA